MTYTSTAASPGNLQISGYSRADTAVAGRFAFQAVTTPATTLRHTLTGRFRVQYFTQPVYAALR